MPVCTAGLSALARGTRREPVHGAAGGAGGAVVAAGGGLRHRHRQPDRRAQRCRAGRSDRVLRQHAGAAHRHLGQPGLPGADRAGAGRQPCRLWPCRSAVRAAGRGAQSGAVAVAASAVPGDAGVRGGLRRGAPAGAARACGAARSRSTTASAKFDLSLGLVEQRAADGAPAGIEGVLEYASDLFDAATRRGAGPAPASGCWRRRWPIPERALGALPILEPAERDTILRRWNDTGAIRARIRCAQADARRRPAGAVCRAGFAHAGRPRR